MSTTFKPLGGSTHPSLMIQGKITISSICNLSHLTIAIKEKKNKKQNLMHKNGMREYKKLMNAYT